jgi:hypothetical protein
MRTILIASIAAPALLGLIALSSAWGQERTRPVAPAWAHDYTARDTFGPDLFAVREVRAECKPARAKATAADRALALYLECRLPGPLRQTCFRAVPNQSLQQLICRTSVTAQPAVCSSTCFVSCQFRRMLPGPICPRAGALLMLGASVLDLAMPADRARERGRILGSDVGRFTHSGAAFCTYAEPWQR